MSDNVEVLWIYGDCQPHALWIHPGLGIEGAAQIYPKGPRSDKVAHLQITGSSIGPHSEQVDDGWMEPFPEFLERFQHIRHLHLNDLSWGDMPERMRTFLLTKLPQITTLYIRAVDFWNSNQFFRVLNAFPDLLDLFLENYIFHVRNHTQSQISSEGLLNLRKLHVGQYSWDPAVLQWILGNRAGIVIDQFALVWDSPNVDTPVSVMHSLAPYVRELILHHHIHEPEEELMATPPEHYAVTKRKPMTLKEYKNLLLGDEEREPKQKVYRACEPPKDWRSAPKLVEDIISQPVRQSALENIVASVLWNNSTLDLLVIKAICSLISPMLRKCMIVLIVHSVEDLEELPWEQLDAILSEVPECLLGPGRFQLIIETFHDAGSHGEDDEDDAAQTPQRGVSSVLKDALQDNSSDEDLQLRVSGVRVGSNDRCEMDRDQDKDDNKVHMLLQRLPRVAARGSLVVKAEATETDGCPCCS